jgi:hypothetical protein
MQFRFGSEILNPSIAVRGIVKRDLMSPLGAPDGRSQTAADLAVVGVPRELAAKSRPGSIWCADQRA